jgi:hypothetical protein
MSDELHPTYITGTIKLSDGSETAFSISADCGWQQWGNHSDKLGATVYLMESMTTAADENGLREAIEEDDLLNTPSIERKFCGGLESVTLEHFCTYVVQDDEDGLRIAWTLFNDPADSYVFNADDPAFREVFEVEHAEALKVQIEKMEAGLS